MARTARSQLLKWGHISSWLAGLMARSDLESLRKTKTAAFGMIRRRYDVFNDTVAYLQELARGAIGSRERSEFEDRIKGSPLEKACEYSRDLDRRIDEVHREET